MPAAYNNNDYSYHIEWAINSKVSLVQYHCYYERPLCHITTVQQINNFQLSSTKLFRT